ncbi:hypothetical protein K8352_17825 [Flavobacteriaceae bacterium F89]|uniref:ThuA-like domain-containing protein n=1 Tax=Cerina litoralis TaxID=2874477 RepID=A0AAE3EZJ5_9FLAO|nr:hypothetical protein [Cerina litoralis]MCG2462626.1 hypothetical protein [Cerina litoralis]
MKIIYIPFIFLLLLACGQKKESEVKENDTAQTAEKHKQWLTFEGADKNAKHIVLISGDEEYRSEEALPQLAKILSKRHGFNCTVLFAQDPASPGIVNPDYLKNIPGLEALTSADMMIIFTRFRALPDNQMQYIDDYLKAGKPVMGIRTATHAFNFGKDSVSNYVRYGNYYEGDKTEWEGGFGRLVLGEKWIAHHGQHKQQSTRGIIAEGAELTGIVNGLADGDVWGSSDVYEVRLPLPGDARHIVMGEVMNRKGEYDENDIFYGMKPSDNDPATTDKEGVNVNDPMMPIAWIKSYQIPRGEKGKAFASTVGAANDLLIEGTRRLLVNGVFWAMDKTVPEKADVRLVGDYQPTKFEFRDNAYWIQKQVRVENFE